MFLGKWQANKAPNAAQRVVAALAQATAWELQRLQRWGQMSAACSNGGKGELQGAISQASDCLDQACTAWRKPGRLWMR